MHIQKRFTSHWPFFVYGAVALAVLSLSGCYHVKLYGRVEKMNGATFASEALLTPDPKLHKSNDGQRLVVSWVLPPYVHPEKELCYLECILYTTKGKKIETRIKIDRNYYHYEYEMSRERMMQEGAIATYRLAIRQGDREIQSFEHKLYKPMIDTEPFEASDDLD